MLVAHLKAATGEDFQLSPMLVDIDDFSPKKIIYLVRNGERIPLRSQWKPEKFQDEFVVGGHVDLIDFLTREVKEAIERLDEKAQ